MTSKRRENINLVSFICLSFLKILIDKRKVTKITEMILCIKMF